jgi:integrase
MTGDEVRRIRRRLGLTQAELSERLGALRALLNSAVDDGVILANPAQGFGRTLRRVRPTATRQEEVKAFDRDQLARFLGVTAKIWPRFYPLFLTMARTGMPIGEAMALQWDDVDFGQREIRVARAISSTGQVDTPKAGHGRTVDMSMAVKDVLERRRTARKEQALADGVEVPAWVFATDAGTAFDHGRVGKVFKRVLKAAKLPAHYSPHSLRHTFTSLLLQQGESPAYVRRQLGHASIKLTRVQIRASSRGEADPRLMRLCGTPRLDPRYPLGSVHVARSLRDER